jgi:hypothetical protein
VAGGYACAMELSMGQRQAVTKKLAITAMHQISSRSIALEGVPALGSFVRTPLRLAYQARAVW